MKGKTNLIDNDVILKINEPGEIFGHNIGARTIKNPIASEQ